MGSRRARDESKAIRTRRFCATRGSALILTQCPIFQYKIAPKFELGNRRASDAGYPKADLRPLCGTPTLTTPETIALRTLRLPDELHIGPLVGKGRRSTVYEAELEGRTVALKLYKPEAIRKFRRRYGVSIARFEHDRCAACYAVPKLSPYIARPIRVYGERGGYSEAFVQEYIEATRLIDLMREQGSVPRETLAALTDIVTAAEMAGLHDLDVCASNVFITETELGWMPRLFDFNMMPQHLHAPNPWVGLLYRLGWRHPSHRDRLMLKHLENWRKKSG